MAMREKPAMCPQCGRIVQGVDLLPADEQRREVVVALLDEALEWYADKPPCPTCAALNQNSRRGWRFNGPRSDERGNSYHLGGIAKKGRDRA
jgi:hypothetical protein